MQKIQHYVLFPNHDNGMRLYGILKRSRYQGHHRSCTPRAASKCCGISLLVRKDDLEAIRKFIDENHIEILKIAAIERDINPRRDRYC